MDLRSKTYNVNRKNTFHIQIDRDLIAGIWLYLDASLTFCLVKKLARLNKKKRSGDSGKNLRNKVMSTILMSTLIPCKFLYSMQISAASLILSLFTPTASFMFSIIQCYTPTITAARTLTWISSPFTHE
jgi:hypothetical protein